jgi:type VI secretion system protein ImpM
VPPFDVGFYGKLPSHGDFLRRRVSDAFVHVWDAWLQECLAISRSVLVDRWLDVYLTSPAWRFACAAGTCGDAPVVGLMVPSVDRVGRYFHLTVVAELPPDFAIVAATVELERFFESAEQLVIDTLGAETVDFDRFDACVINLRGELESVDHSGGVRLDAAASAVLQDNAGSLWQIPIGTPSDLGGVFRDLATRRLAAVYDPLVLWWTEGSAVVEPSCLVTKGLPPPHSFAALLDGAWTAHEWQSISGSGGPAPVASDTLIDDLAELHFRSAGASDVGRVRTVNQDSMLERTDAGLWAVADGLGGHQNGEVASQMVCDALADFVPPASFEQLIASAGDRLREVNDYLARAAARSNQPVLSGSTVVTLMVRGTRCAVLWAGDSRVYRARDGRLEQLTRDHSLVPEPQGLTSQSNVVTRAIGGEATLTLDVARDRVRAGDRFLLCSDGLTRIVPDAQIQHWMRHQDIQASVEGLIDATLAAGAPDNVTALIVEAYL